MDLVKLWLHEASRVYGDKLIETKDMDTFQKMKLDIAKAGFEASLYIMHNIMCIGCSIIDGNPIALILSSSHNMGTIINFYVGYRPGGY